MTDIEVHIDLKPRIRKLEIATRYLAQTNFMGEYASVFKGRGIEFADYREYQPTDDSSLIDWKASMRAGQMLVREYMEERNLTVLLLVDSSSSMIFGSHDKLKHEYAAELIASLARGALFEGDSVGVMMFNEGVVAHTPPYIGMQQTYHIFKNLANPANYGGPCHFNKAIVEMSSRLERYSILMLVSDFIGLDEDGRRFLRIAAKKYEVIAIVVRDPRDNELPEGLNLVTIRDPYGRRQKIIDVDKVRARFNAEARKELLELEDFFKRSGIDYVILDTSKPFTVSMIKFFKRRKDKWR